MSTISSTSKFQAIDFPECPGVYLMKNHKGKIIYVGKANNLRKRLSSYFRISEQLPLKTKIIMQQVENIDYLCTNTEKEALLLEASLIKKHKPAYNIVLRDDKAYILFKLDKKVNFPRLTLTRKVANDNSIYFGPFTSALAARSTLKVINRIFALRKCKDSVFQNRTRPCLQYHIGRCLAPCVYSVSKEKYAHIVKRLELFLSGRSKELLQKLQAEMLEASQELNFEKAAELRDQIQAIQNTVEQQSVVFPEGGDIDIIGLSKTEKGIALGISFIREGKLLDSKNYFWEDSADFHQQSEEQMQIEQEVLAEEHELLSNFLIQFYSPGKYIPDKIILPFKINSPVLEEIFTERRGKKVHIKTGVQVKEKKLIHLAQTNALQKNNTEQNTYPLISLSRKLNLFSEPHRIEAIDASHLHGQGVMVGQVVFEQGKPLKSAYRIYKFPELEGSHDDYKALASWVHRRMKAGPPWPDLVLIDGGKGHLKAVEKALSQYRKNIDIRNSDIPEHKYLHYGWELVAIAKKDRRQGELEDQIYRPQRKNPVKLKTGSSELLLLQHIRDNVHRFVLSKQKQSRKKKVTESRLEKLSSIGPKTATILLNHFGSLQSVYKASQEELCNVPGIGPKKAQSLYQAIQDIK